MGSERRLGCSKAGCPSWSTKLVALQDWPDSCNLNLYEDGDHSVGWHSDDEFLFQGALPVLLLASSPVGLGSDNPTEIAIDSVDSFFVFFLPCHFCKSNTDIVFFV